MTDLLSHKTTTQALSLFDDFCLLMDRTNNTDSIDSLQQVNTMAGVKKFPARIKSATLCWYAMKAAINGKQLATTE
jgi:nitrogen fixation NifU-like protein